MKTLQDPDHFDYQVSSPVETLKPVTNSFHLHIIPKSVRAPVDISNVSMQSSAPFN
jgi:hypothetical protein